MSATQLGSRERPRQAKTLGRCRVCQSHELFDGWWDPEGLASDGHHAGDEWLTSCSSCGEFYQVG